MDDKDYAVIGSFVIANLGTIFGIFKWYLAQQIKLEKRLLTIEYDIDGIALALGTKRAIGQKSAKAVDETEDPAQT